MKKYLAAILILSLLLVGGAVYFFLPSPLAKGACATVTDWDIEDRSEAKLNHPMGVALANGFVFVADTENASVKKYREDGSFVSEWRGFKRPVDVAAAGRFVYVVDFLTDRVTKLRTDGTVVAEWGRRGNGDGEFDAPSGIAVDNQGNVYVADFYNHRIQKFSSDGGFLLKWGSQGRWSGQFHYATDVAVTVLGEVFVADAYNHRIQRFTSEGDFLGKWGGIGYGLSGKWPGWFRLAKAVAVDSHGNVYVADAFNHRLQKFTTHGQLLAMWSQLESGSEKLQYPAGVAAGLNGRIYVSDFFANRIWKVQCS